MNELFQRIGCNQFASIVHVFNVNVFLRINVGFQSIEDFLSYFTVRAVLSKGTNVIIADTMRLPQMLIQFLPARKRFRAHDAAVVSRLRPMDTLMRVVMSFHVVSKEKNKSL